MTNRLNLNYVNSRIQQAAQKMADQIAKAQFDWTDKLMRSVLPPDMWEKAHSLDAKERKEVFRWLKKRKIAFMQHPGKKTLVRGKELLGDFHVRVEGTRLQIIARDFINKKKDEGTPPQVPS